MDTYDFARGVAKIMDRSDEIGLLDLVHERRAKLQRITDSDRAFKTLVHLVVDAVKPEFVPRLMPREPVTVREVARILSDLAGHTRPLPRGVPVMLDREMHLLFRKSVFSHFLQLLEAEDYAATRQPPRKDDEEDPPVVEFESDGIRINQAAMLRWTMVVMDPSRFQAVADFLRTVSPDEHGLWYFRIMQAAARLDHVPEEDELRRLLGLLRHPRAVN